MAWNDRFSPDAIRQVPRPLRIAFALFVTAACLFPLGQAPLGGLLGAGLALCCWWMAALKPEAPPDAAGRPPRKAAWRALGPFRGAQALAVAAGMLVALGIGMTGVAALADEEAWARAPRVQARVEAIRRAARGPGMGVSYTVMLPEGPRRARERLPAGEAAALSPGQPVEARYRRRAGAAPEIRLERGRSRRAEAWLGIGFALLAEGFGAYALGKLRERAGAEAGRPLLG